MDRIFANFFRKRENPTPVDTLVPKSTMPSEPKVQGGDYQERIVYATGPQIALTVSAVYRATNLRADTMGCMPVQYQKKDFEKGNFTTDMRGLGRRLNYLLQEEPNPIMSAMSMWQLGEINRLLYGNAFVYIERDEFDFPIRLWLVKNGGYNIATGTYSSIVYLTDQGYKTRVNVPRRDVLHFPNTFRTMNGFWGIPTLEYAIEALTLNKTLRSQALETAAKGGRVKLLIGEEKPSSGNASTLAYGLMNKGEMDDYAEELQKKWNSGHDIISIRGIGVTEKISMTAADMQAMEQTGMTYDDVARFWGIPRPLLMLDTNSHYNDYQNATMEFHTRTILPQKTGNEKEIARKLIDYKDYGVRRIHICEEPLLAMDPERRAKVDLLNLQTGAKSINEIRAGHDMPAVEGGDRIFRTANVKGLDEDGGSTELQPGTYTVNDNNDGKD